MIETLGITLHRLASRMPMKKPSLTRDPSPVIPLLELTDLAVSRLPG